MPPISLTYIFNNKSWLNYKSLVSYIQAGITLLFLILIVIFKNLFIQRFSYLVPFDIGPITNAVLIALVITGLLSSAVDIYSGSQFAQIYKKTLLLKADSPLKIHQEILNEYQTFFKYFGILSIIQAVIMVIVFASVAGTFIAFFITYAAHNSSVQNCGFSDIGSKNCSYFTN